MRVATTLSLNVNALLHAIWRQHVHPRPSVQVTVLPRPRKSAQVRTSCGTFLLYRCRTDVRACHAPDRRLTSDDLSLLGQQDAADVERWSPPSLEILSWVAPGWLPGAVTACTAFRPVDRGNRVAGART
jgi:hypothetical protein